MCCLCVSVPWPATDDVDEGAAADIGTAVVFWEVTCLCAVTSIGLVACGNTRPSICLSGHLSLI